MIPDLSEYPATLQGAEALRQDLRPLIVDMWKTERDSKSDDVVVVINTQTNQVHIDTRNAIYRQLQKVNPKVKFLDRLKEPAPSKAGNITVWSIIGFNNGRVCILPITLARS
jgi:hypothetical protein